MPGRLTESTRAFREAFSSKGLRRLQLALAGSVIGDWAFSIALAVYAYDAGGAKAVGLLALARWTLAAFAAPFLSVLADRYRRRSVMLASDSIRLLATAGAAVAVWTSAPAVIVYAAALIVTAVSTAFQPAQTALLPSLTSSPEQLTAANVVTSTIESVGTFLGPALGGADAGLGRHRHGDGDRLADVRLVAGDAVGHPPRRAPDQGGARRRASWRRWPRGSPRSAATPACD